MILVQIAEWEKGYLRDTTHSIYIHRTCNHVGNDSTYKCNN